MHPDLVSRIGLSGIPSKSIHMQCAYGLIPESYLREVHLRITGDNRGGSLAGDSTGYSGNRFVRWFSIRHSQAKTKRRWIQLHSIIDIATRAILDYHVTDGYTSDITGMWPMLPAADGNGNFLPGLGLPGQTDMRRDSRHGHDAPHPAQIQHDLQNGGSQAWGEMTRTHRDDLVQVHGRVPPAPIIEAVFGAIKKMYGNHLRGRRLVRQNREVAIRIICYNIEVVARSHVKSGITHESLTAMAA